MTTGHRVATESEQGGDGHWQRLDPRMLLVHPVKELIRFLPVLIGIFIAGRASGGEPWQVIGVAIPIGLGLLRYLTTSFRIAAGRIELRRGLLNKHVLSTALDRVRTVDITASPIHRVLGLTTVRIGTGTASTNNDDRLDLDGMLADRARRLRENLLRVTPAEDDADESAATPVERVVLSFDPAWVRFAPLTSSGVVIAAGVLGVGSQVLDSLGGFERVDPSQWFNGTAGVPFWLAVPVGLITLLLLISVLAITGYLVTNWGFTLDHSRSAEGGAWHLRRGLLTTRETSLDDERVGGVTVGEPIGLRLAGGGRLSAIVTGLDRQQASSSVLVPPAPRALVARVAREVLGVNGPVDCPLVDHGPDARRRRFSRALVPALVLTGAALLAVLLADTSTWLLVPAALAPIVGFGLAMDRARSLGHALTQGYLVSRSGSLYRHRDVLAVDDVIGWNLRSTWFQRRAGLTALVATTAGGPQSVTVLDIPETAAVALTIEAMPHLVEQFTN